MAFPYPPPSQQDSDHFLFLKIAAALYEIQSGGGGGGLPDQTGHAGEFLTTDGTDASWVPLAGGGDVVASGTLTNNSLIIGQGGTTVAATTTGTGILTFLGTPSSANLAAAVTGETGTGALVFATSPTLVTPALGTPSALVLTNATGLPLTTGVTGQLAGANIQDGAIDSDKLAGDAVATGNIQNNAVTYAKLPSETASTLLGRGDSGNGETQEITLGSGLTMSGTTLSASGGGGGSPAGSDTQVQYNNSGSFGASANLTFSGASLSLGQNLGADAGVFRVYGSGAGTSGSVIIYSGTGPVTGSINAAGLTTDQFASLPDATGVIVLEDNTATLTNKTIDGSNNTITNVSLTTGVTGTLPLGNGGTGQTTAQAAINAFMAASGALSQGDVFYYNGTNVVRLAAGTADHFLQTKGAGQNPVWAAGGGGSGGATNIYIPASAMIPRVTNGAGVNSSETTTNDVNYDTLDFDATTSEGAQFWVTMPNNWNAGTVTFKPQWTADSGTGTFICTLAARALANDDAIDTAFGTSQSSTDTLIATGDLHIGPASSAITVGGTPATGVPIVFQVTRDVSDTLNADARLIGIEITFN